MSEHMMPISAFRHIPECPVRRGPDCISHCICRDENIRKWRMELNGFPAFAIIASSRGEARMAAYLLGHEAGYFRDFKTFLAAIKSFRRMEWEALP